MQLTIRLSAIAIIVSIFASACTKKSTADTIVYNAKIYTVDGRFSTVEAMVIKDKKIIALGKGDSLMAKYNCTDKIDAKGKFIYPGLIDAHTHFLGYGLQLKNLNLVGSTSWENVLVKIAAFAKDWDWTSNKWIVGRGWDQNDWDKKGFPTNESLDKQYPNTPILLTRIDGHAAIANSKALALANIKPGQKIEGGVIETKDGKLTGILIDNATSLVENIIPLPTTEDKKQALLAAQKNCFAVGLTTVDDCGLDYADVETITALYSKGALQMKMYIMLSDKKDNYDYLLKRGKISTLQLTVNGFKVYGDGALGSRGACLLQHYTDKPKETGFLLSSLAHFDSVAQLLYTNKFQMCTHAIGDSANRALLKIYAKYLNGKNDLRWRIEHAQVVNEKDFNFFGQYNIIPSVQPTHATSDMYWAKDRLGNERLKGAYAYKQLLQQNGWLPLGTDFPVEDISPFKTFYAAVVRKDAKDFPATGFQMENALTRQEALQGMTIWAAKSNFEETTKGSLEIGKYADFIILDQDIMECAANAILQTNVLNTWINGVLVWSK
jgi:predicted amidohydrolase YtcJ